ncbi:hypothetical protein Tco_0901750, partial [Tanacetum coccineum]
NESEDDEMKSDEEQGMDDITDQFDDDADARLEEPTNTATGIVQGDGNDAEMTKARQGNENLETTHEQVVEDAYVTISTVLNLLEIVSPLDVHVHHEVPRTQAPTLLTIPVSVIPESSSVFTNIPQSSYTFTPTPIQATPTPPLTIETTNPLSNLPDFSLSLTARIKEHVKDQLPQILAQEVSNFAPPVASTLTEFELKKILLDKMEKSESYLTASEHRYCYDGLKKSYALDKDFFYSYDVYSLKRGRKDKDKDEDASARSDRGLKKRKLSKDAEPTTKPKKKDSMYGSSKGTKC